MLFSAVTPRAITRSHPLPSKTTLALLRNTLVYEATPQVRLRVRGQGTVRCLVHQASKPGDSAIQGAPKRFRSKVPERLTLSEFAFSIGSHHGKLHDLSSLNIAKHEDLSISKDSSILMLVTPNLIHRLGKEDNVLKDLLPSLIDEKTTVESLHVLVAVVDELPHPENDSIFDESLRKSWIARTGFQGISIYCTQSNENRSRIAKALEVENNSDAFAKSEHGILTLEIPERYDSDVEAYGTRKRSIFRNPLVNYTVRLPLSNTLFQNGKESTLYAQEWQISSNGGEKPQYDMLKSRHLSEFKARLLPSPSLHRKPPFSHGQMQRLVPFRTVSSSMGNVVSTLNEDHTGTTQIPASRELEISVPEFLEDLEPMSYEIWAQIIPREVWNGRPQHLDQSEDIDDRLDYLSLGHRFHKVVGGGGGWGQKHGLIALDPENGFPAPNSDVREPIDFETNPIEQTVRPGDAVSFVVVWSSKKFRQKWPIVLERDTNLAMSYRAYSFGTAATTHREPTEPPSRGSTTFVIPGYFGGRSQKPASMSIDLSGPEGETHCGSQRLGNVVMTKLPPMTSFIYGVKPRRHLSRSREYRYLQKISRMSESELSERDGSKGAKRTVIIDNSSKEYIRFKIMDSAIRRANEATLKPSPETETETKTKT